ncbi:PaaI family thioesterase [Desulfosarcina sp.]|uniref:PaaI family thioesterase n=1 Tax=Desulfosarcina sp. TaxID=2027861 RepID=UPI00356622D0
MLSPNPAYIGALIDVVNSSPFPTHMRMQLIAIAFDHAVVSLKIDTCHFQPYGIVHGGVLATLIDTATFWAAYLRLPGDDGLVNIDLKLNYLKPAGEGMLTATGRCIRAGRSLSYAEAGVSDADGNLVAHGTSTLMALPGKGLAFKENKFLDD